MVESVHEAQAYVSPVMSSQDVAYCQFHYLVARAHGGTQRLPDAYDLMGQSAAFAGRWRRGPGAWSDFEWRTNLLWGEVLSLEKVDVPGAGTESNAMTRVRLQRPLRGLFREPGSGIDESNRVGEHHGQADGAGHGGSIETPQGFGAPLPGDLNSFARFRSTWSLKSIWAQPMSILLVTKPMAPMAR